MTDIIGCTLCGAKASDALWHFVTPGKEDGVVVHQFGTLCEEHVIVAWAGKAGTVAIPDRAPVIEVEVADPGC